MDLTVDQLCDVSLGLVDSAHKVDLLNQDLFLARLVARLDLQGIYEVRIQAGERVRIETDKTGENVEHQLTNNDEVFAEIMSLEWYAAAIIEFRYP
ncbi:hypothetical protein EKO04_011222 [Ascochyta lentis]|uniref:Uncharacterized protein n=1 Tax=Ascochyta lentis TaxID=205686 RepID=A0A8H7MDL9_9PLEO|nr:hypothetical protein EKO04_011222 [Ascochyta lentis]